MRTKVKIIAISTLAIGLISMGCNDANKKVLPKNNETKEITQKKETSFKNDVKLKSSLVCYVNNRYMGIEQTPVEVDGKIYYGCCEGCVEKLKKVRETRYALDPYSKSEVDKAVAYIVLNPNGSGEVLYFQSEENYLLFTR